MNLTTEQKKHCAAIRTAAANGERTEVYDNDFHEWKQGDPFECLPSYSPEKIPDRWRIAPKKVVRPWAGPDDVPGPVCWIRGVYDDGKPDYRMTMIIGFAGEVSYITCSCGCNPVVCSHRFDDTDWKHFQYSTDRKTWHPCTVEEQQ